MSCPSRRPPGRRTAGGRTADGWAWAPRRGIRQLTAGLEVSGVPVASALHGDVQADGLGVLSGRLVAGIGMAEDAHGGVVPEHPGDAAVCALGAVGHDDHAACWLKPMPTPPPWWKLTQEAPPPTAVMALSSGQSLTASEPSLMASVSRLGLATEPLSRWSRPMTMGAFTLPVRTSSLNFSPARWRSPRRSSRCGRAAPGRRSSPGRP